MAKILNAHAIITTNVTPGSVSPSEGWGLNVADGSLADTVDLVEGTADAVLTGVVVTPLSSGVVGYGQATGQAVEVAMGEVMVEAESADTDTDSIAFNSTNYAVGTAVGFNSGKYIAGATTGSPAQIISARGVVVGLKYVGSTFTAAIILINKVLG